MVIDKEDAPARKGIFMIDASAGYIKDGPKNRLRDQDIHKIVDVFNKQAEVPKYSRMVSFDEIEKNEYNLNLPRYIDSQEAEDLQDIEGHLRGGIPQEDTDALERFWAVCPGLKSALFKPNRPGYVDLAIDKSQIRATIFEHPEFVSFVEGMNRHFEDWRDKASKRLKELSPGCHPKEVIAELSKSLLEHYQNKPLIDSYDIYQHLMDYWEEVMQDDCYLIAADGWVAEPSRIVELDKKGKERDKGWECELLPKRLIRDNSFMDEQCKINALVTQLEGVMTKLMEIEDEHGGEDGLLSELEKINRVCVMARLKEVQGDEEAKGEVKVLADWLELNSQESELKKRIKEAEISLDTSVFEQFGKLRQCDVQDLAVSTKWLATIDRMVNDELYGICDHLSRRVLELAGRYHHALPELTSAASRLEANVYTHLKTMGFKWV